MAGKKEKKSKATSSQTPPSVVTPKKFSSKASQYGCSVQIAPAQLEKAVSALRTYANDQAKEANMLFDGDNVPIMLLFALSKPADRKKRVPHLIPLENPLFKDDAEVCLITSDPQRKFKDMLEAEPVPAIKKIIGYDKVKKRYNTHVYKRQLARDFELFLCDDNVYSAMPSLTGQKVMQSKPPIPVVLKKGEVQNNINKVLSSAHVRVPAGSCVSVRFAKANFTLEQTMANAEAVLKGTLQFLEKQGLEVNCVNVQAQDCPALPIFTRKIAEDAVLTPQKLKHERAAEREADREGKRKARQEKMLKKQLKRKKPASEQTMRDLDVQDSDIEEQEPSSPVVSKGIKKMEVATPKKSKKDKTATAQVSKKKGKKAASVAAASEPIKKKKKKVVKA